MKTLLPILLLALALPGLSVAQIVINEVDADTPGSDAAEFIELYDGGAGNTPVTGLALVLYNGNGDSVYASFDLVGTTNAQGFFLCGPSTFPGGVDFVIDTSGGGTTNLVQNGADAVALYMDSAMNLAPGTAVTTTNLLDALVYDTNDSDDTGLLSVLTPGQPQINEDGGGNKDTESNSRCPDGGTPLETTTYFQVTPTPGAPNTPVCPSFDHDIICTNLPNGLDAEATFSVGSGTPMNTVFLAATVQNVFQVPTGWFFGVNMPIGELVAELNAGNPWVGVLDATGNYSYVVPLLGMTCPFTNTIHLDTVAIEFTPTTILQVSVAKTITL